MPKSPTELTGAQHDIVLMLWNSPTPKTVTEIWQSLARPVARTTVLTWVQRLEKRGWLRRAESEDGFAYSATRAPEDAATNVAERIVDTLFAGSPSGLVLALAGRGRIDAQEVARLKSLLDELEKNHG